MHPQIYTFKNRSVTVYAAETPRVLLIQPVDAHDRELLDHQAALMAERSAVPFALAAFEIKDWNRELSPWSAPPVFGNEAFGRSAPETLAFVEDSLIPFVLETLCILPGGRLPLGLGGYSLAGLFALWAGYESRLFSGVAGVSPSVWFPGWPEYAESRTPHAAHVYLSLGDREAKARNPVMATVADRLREHDERLRLQNISCFLEWNVGNHFRDSDLRTAKGFCWLLEHMI